MQVFFRKAVALVGLLGFLAITLGYSATILGLFNPLDWIPNPRTLVILLAALGSLTLSCCLSNCVMVFRYGGMMVAGTSNSLPTSSKDDTMPSKSSAVTWTVLLSRALWNPGFCAVFLTLVLAYPGYRFVRYAWNSGESAEPYAAGIWLPEKYEIIEVDMAEADVIARERLGNVAIYSRSFDEYKKYYSRSQHLICWSRDGQVAYFAKEEGYISKIEGRPTKLRETGVQYLALNPNPGFRSVMMTETNPGVFKVVPGRAWVWSIGMSILAVIGIFFAFGIMWIIIGALVEKTATK